MYPSQEGYDKIRPRVTNKDIDPYLCRRFPVISGFRLEWDSRRPPGQRILGLWLTATDPKMAVREDPALLADEAVKGEPVPREAGGKQYKVVTREWMYQGHDGFETLMGKHCLVDDESGMIMSSIVRKFLLGTLFSVSLRSAF
jgi:5'-nucleotidase